MNVMEQLVPVFRMVFDDDDIQIAPEMNANDIEGWDSLSHINLIVAIETTFNIRFAPKELLTLRNIGDLSSCVERKIGLIAPGNG